MSQKRTDDNPWKALFLVSVLGADFAACVTAGFFAGRWISGLAGGHPLWIVAGLMAGIIAGVFTAYLLVRPFISEGKDE